MNATASRPGAITLPRTLLYVALAAVCFHLAYSSRLLSGFVLGYILCLVMLARAKTGRRAFYSGLAVGLLTAGPQLTCFWRIFGAPAVALWLVLAFWIGLFVALARLCLIRLRPLWAAMAIPLLWIGLEFFRSELYFLRFSWLNPGYAFAGNLPLPLFGLLGMYGVGFLAALGCALLACHSGRERWLAAVAAGVVLTIITVAARAMPGRSMTVADKEVRFAALQLEFPNEFVLVASLNKLVEAHPESELLVLSEYTFDGPVPGQIMDWCREHRRYLIVGGKEPAAGDNFYNTAFVIGPDGKVVFRQAKTVPIQFFRDGLPAPKQSLWNSPWGRIGICVCYDLSYRRVTDRLIAQGAEALICPTMDVADWGRHQHELHARVAPVRAAEYGVPILRVASSGISQLVEADGRIAGSAPFPGQLASFSGRLQLRGAGHLPLDHWLAPMAAALTALAIVWFGIENVRGPVNRSRKGRFEVASPAGSSPATSASEIRGDETF